MSSVQSFTKDHLWVMETEDERYRVGVTEVLLDDLDEIKSIVLPEPGEALSLGEAFAEINGREGMIDVYMPVDGVIAEINEEILNDPETLADDPLEAWLVEVEDIGETDELLTEDEYYHYVHNDDIDD